MPEIRLTRTAERDLRRVGLGVERNRLRRALGQFGAGAEHLDIKALVGAKPWLRLRVGDLRVLYRVRDDGGLQVARIVHRGELAAGVAALPEE